MIVQSEESAAAAKALDVEISLLASHVGDNTPFKETVKRSFNMTLPEFHAMQTALANLLLGFGDKTAGVSLAADPSAGP